MAKGTGSGISGGGGGSGTGGAGGAGGAGGKGPVGTPQNPAPNGYTGPVDGKDISGTWQPSANAQNISRFRADPKQIEEVMDAQGFRNKPQLVTDKAEFDKMVSQANGGNGLLLYRGYGAKDAQTLKDYKDSLRSGEWYVQCGGGAVHGYGMYANCMLDGKPNPSQKSDSQRYANRYGKYTKLEQMTMHPSAKIGDETQLRREMSKFNRDEKRKAVASTIDQMKKSGSRAEKAVAKRYERDGDLLFDASRSASRQYQIEFDRAKDKIRDAASKARKYTDVGVYATAKGYDMYHDGRGRYSVILNRSKLVIYDG